ncbi:MAG: FAD-binding protein [Deltaproteobacteria bacterium]|nr:FAD-binding protein [Deltaproteobacteria bacterium]
MERHKAAKEIWTWIDLRGEKFFWSSIRLLSKARQLAMDISGRACAILMDHAGRDREGKPSGGPQALSIEWAAERCLEHGADIVYAVDEKFLALPVAENYAKALHYAIRKKNPLLVMLSVTDFCREIGARTAVLVDSGMIAECVDLRWEEESIVGRSPSWGGQIMADITFSGDRGTGFVTLQSHGLELSKARGEPGVTEQIDIHEVAPARKIRLISSSREYEEHQRLEEAKVVVVGGAGLGDAEGFGLVRELARSLGGEVGATRPPVLEHWVEEDRLVGQTGKTVRPELLFSVGTSGAIQYTAGITESKRIIAVNRDPNAPIFHLADLGIVADARKFLLLLNEKIRQAAMRRLAEERKEEESKKGREGMGLRVRRLRENLGMSVEELAQATGQTPELIQHVENDEVTPSVGFLLRFARAMNVNPATFLKEEDKRVIRDMRAREFMKRTQNYSYQTLSPGGEGDHLRAFMITIEPRQVHKPVAYKHEGEEFIFVMEGDLRLTLGNKVHHLRRGESIHFNSDIPHKLKSISDETTRCLVVLYTP